MRITGRAAFHIYLSVLSLAGMYVVYLATSRMGPGVSTDSAMILSSGENLFQGRGLVDYTGSELTQFPPLYAVLLGLGSLATGLDIFVVGWALNILVFGALVWFSGIYLRRGFPGEPIFAYLGAFVVAASTSLIEISANIASDPLFMLMVIFFLMLNAAYLRSRESKYVVLAGGLTILACFQRYAGLTLVIAGALVTIYANRRQPIRALTGGLLFGVLTAAPIFAWGYLHNAPVNGTVFGGRLPAIPTGNLSAGAEKVLYWFIPYRVIAAVGPVLLATIAVLILSVAILATDRRRFLKTIGRPAILPNVVFLLVYFAVLVFDISYYELKGLETDRIHIVALTSVLVIVAAIGSVLLEASAVRFGSRWTHGVVILLFLAWSSYPISKTREYVRNSMLRGDVSPYNSINKGDIQGSQLATYLHSLDVQGHAVYSNGCDTAWFIMRREITPIPTLRSADRVAELRQRYPAWPGNSSSAYVVWIGAESYKASYATPAELAAIADLSELYADATASVFSATAR